MTRQADYSMRVEVFALDTCSEADQQMLARKGPEVAFVDNSMPPGYILLLDRDLVDIDEEFLPESYSQEFRDWLRDRQKDGICWLRLCSALNKS